MLKGLKEGETGRKIENTAPGTNEQAVSLDKRARQCKHPSDACLKKLSLDGGISRAIVLVGQIACPPS